MQNRQKTALRLLRLTVAASILIPLLLFVYVAFLEFNSATRQADDRLQLSLNVVQEHALKVLETVERAIAETNEIVADFSDEQIREKEPALHARLQKIAVSLPHLQSIAIIDARARQLVTSISSPPVQVDLRDRDYFKALAERDVGLFIGQVRPGTPTFLPYFNIARRRGTSDGSFSGVINVTVLPSYFEEFYGRIIEGNRDGTTMTLIRDNGSVLVRYPNVAGSPSTVPQTVPFMSNIRANPERGFYVGVSGIDGQLRRAAYRRLPGFPVYVLASVSEDAIRQSWLLYMSTHMIIGVPATLLLIAISILALRRAQALEAEVAARERAEDALRQAQKMEVIGQLTGGIAHDFNNLLMVVIGGVDRLRASVTESRQIRTLDMIMSSAKRGENLIRHLLTFSRRQAISPAAIDVRKFFQQIEDVLHGTLSRSIQLDVTRPDTECVVRADPGELELAILNICVNARDAMPGGGRLTLSAERRTLSGGAEVEDLAGEFVAIRIADTGTGIPDEVLSRVFEPFFTTKAPGVGTGLGLSQVYGFAKQSGGTVLIRTSPAGTTMTLLLPATEAEPEEVEPATGNGGNAASARARILVVDDTPEVAQISKDYLEKNGHRVDVATGGSEALAFLARNEVDLVLSDIVMPGGMDGLDVARRVQELYPEIPVILVTGYSASADAARREGFDVLRKPLDAGRMIEAVESRLARKSRVTASV